VCGHQPQDAVEGADSQGADLEPGCAEGMVYLSANNITTLLMDLALVPMSAERRSAGGLLQFDHWPGGCFLLQSVSEDPFPGIIQTGEVLGLDLSACKSPGGKFCIGISKDVARRLQEHNSGVSRWTRGRALGL
jgi:hypothetical protein